MTLEEAIEWITNEGKWLGEFNADMLAHGDYPSSREEAIATILNAVVKGELK